jgi:hypothetical protein
LKSFRRSSMLIVASAVFALAAFSLTYFVWPYGFYSILWRVQNLFPPTLTIASGSQSLPTSDVVPFTLKIIDPNIAGDCKMVGDIDGDGFVDLIIGGMPAEGLNWYQYPDWKKTVIATPNNEFTTDGALGDVDADGDLDIIVPDGDQGDNLVWFENPKPSGDPFEGSQWQRHEVGAVDGWGKDVFTEDYDGDGHLDIATRNDGSAMIFFQTQQATWVHMQFQDVDTGHEGMAQGDVNGDGDADLVLHGVWLRNPGGAAARTESNWTEYRIGDANSDFKALVTDLNQDGQADVLFSSSENVADVNWWTPTTGDPGGSWEKHTILNSLEKAHTLQAADMDKDGDQDLVVAQMHTSSSNEIMVLYNVDGQATTWEKQLVDTGGLHNGVVADIGNDGDFDIFGANWTGNPPVRLWINPLESTKEWRYNQVTDKNLQTFGLTFGSIDDDNLMDILSGPFWYQNPGGDLTGEWSQFPLPEGMHAILTLDVDDDSLTDVIAQKDESDIALYWLEPQDKTVTAWESIKLGTVDKASHSLGAQGHRIGQVEAGGKPEVLISSGNGIYYFRIPENPSSGNWPRVHVSSNPSDEGFALGDFDRDGSLDIAATTGESKLVEWYQNPGDGSDNWTAYSIGNFSEALFPDRTEVADLNGDGRMDIIVTEENGESSAAETFWWEQPADPTMGEWPRHLVVVQGTTNSMDVSDIDNDGDVDLVLAEHRGAKRLSLWINDGKGNFEEHLISVGKESHLGARTIDLDGDGNLEIVSIAWDDYGKIHLWKSASQVCNAGKNRLYLGAIYRYE